MCSVLECSQESCPFSFSDFAAYGEGLGCLPSPWEIIKLREKGYTWACHSNLDKPCLGALNYLREEGKDYKVINPQLVTLDEDWSKYLKS